MSLKAKFSLGLLSLSCAFVNYASTEPSASKKSATPTLWQGVAIGGLAGITEVSLLGQPLSYAMNQRVQSRPLATNPLAWYRGGLANAAGMAPITAIQQVVNLKGQTLLQQYQNAALSDTQKMTVALLAGATSALAATPSEAIPVYLQKPECAGKSTLQALQELKLRAWRGLVPTAGRDGLFTVGYAALAPVLQSRVHAELVGTRWENYTTTAEFGATVGAGVLTAVATQPLAVLKTQLQADPFARSYRRTLDAANATYRQAGLPGYFKGLVPRGARVMCAIPVLNKASEFYREKLVAE